MPAIECFLCPPDPDSFLVTPALIITRGRDAITEQPARAFVIQLEWLMWGVGICIEF